MPYLPIDPKHVGRTYEAVIRVNSQSGKGGVAYVMKAEHGFDLPRRMQIEFSKTIQHITEDSGTEISPVVMWEAFQRRVPARRRRATCSSATSCTPATGRATVTAQVVVDGEHHTVAGEGSGPIAAFVRGPARERSASSSTSSTTPSTPSGAAPRRRRRPTSSRSRGDDDGAGETRWGIGVDPDITTAGLKAVLGALERQQR